MEEARAGGRRGKGRQQIQRACACVKSYTQIAYGDARVICYSQPSYMKGPDPTTTRPRTNLQATFREAPHPRRPYLQSGRPVSLCATRCQPKRKAQMSIRYLKRYLGREMCRPNLVRARGHPGMALAADDRLPQRRRLTPHVLQQRVETLRMEGPILQVKSSKQELV